MQGYLAALTLVVMLILVSTRVILLTRSGTRVMNFGRTDRADLLILPFALFYFYTVFAAAFGRPLVSTQTFFQSDVVAGLGVACCLAGLVFLGLSLVAFGRSFRVGIDAEQPDELVTGGIFGVSRNPIYVGFFLVLLGEFLVFPNWVLLAYLIAGTWLLNRQALREEAFLREHYGQAYADYCAKVRRYL